MVSKRKTLGKPPLIVVTVGTSSFPFTRLFKSVDEVLISQKKRYQLIVQYGNTNYKWRYPFVTSECEFSPPEMKQLLKKADKIITHAGFGTLFDIYSVHAVMPLIVARQKKYHEHVDDHQMYYLNFIKNKYPKSNSQFFCSKSFCTSIIQSYLINNSIPNIFNKILFLSKNTNIQFQSKLQNYIYSKTV